MLLKTISATLLCFLSLGSIAQNSEPNLKIDYQITLYEGAQVDYAQLHVYSSGAYYASKYDAAATEAKDYSGERIVDTGSAAYIQYDQQSDSIFSLAKMKDRDPQEVLIGEKRQEIKWLLVDSVKVIDGQPCKFAQGNFRGRKYIAWYNPSIDVNEIGPWKLHGLPGAVIHACDSTEYISFRALKISSSEEEAVKTILNPKLSIVSRQEQRAYQDKLAQKMENREAPEGLTYKLKVTLNRLEKN